MNNFESALVYHVNACLIPHALTTAAIGGMPVVIFRRAFTDPVDMPKGLGAAFDFDFLGRQFHFLNLAR